MSGVISQASPEEMTVVRELFQEYAASLGVDLGYQGFAAELAGLPAGMPRPEAGCFSPAWVTCRWAAARVDRSERAPAR